MQDKPINGIIYVATNLINGKQYVGQTTRTLNERIKQHCLKTKKNSSIINNAILYYGKDWFDWNIIDIVFNIEELNNKESYWIKKLNTLSPNGYNLTTGGLNYTRTDETKKKIIEAHKNYSKETKDKIRNILLSYRIKYNLTFNGKTQTIPEWAKEYGINVRTLYYRLDKGLSIEEALIYEKEKRVLYNNKIFTIKELSKELNIPSNVLHSRIKYNWNENCWNKPITSQEGTKLKYNNKELTIEQWANELGISTTTIRKRLNKNWQIEKILSKERYNKKHNK